MKHLIITTILLCSIGVMGQTKPAGDNSLYICYDHYMIADNSMNWHLQSDTVAVYMLTTIHFKADVNIPVMQRLGYSVTPRISYNGLLNITYLDKDKKPLPENVIVWMAVKR